MHGRFRRLAAALTVLAVLGVAAAPAAAESPAASEVRAVGDKTPAMADLLILRPLGLVSLIVGGGLFVVAAPLTLITRPMEIDKPFEALLGGPARFTFGDPLGGH